MRTIFHAFAGLVTLAMCAVSVAQPRSKQLFVTNNASGTVATFDVQPNGQMSLIQVIACGVNPYDVAIHPNGSRVVVTNASAALAEPVYTFDIAPLGMLIPTGSPLVIGDGTLSVAVGANGHALITEATQDDLVSLNIDGPTPVLAGAAGAGIFPVEVAVSRDGQFAFVSGTQGNGYLNTYRLNSNGSISALGLPAATTGLGTGQGLATHPTLDVVYQSTGLGNQVQAYAYNSAGQATLIGSASNGGNSCVEMAVHPSGRWLYVCNVVSDTLTVMPIQSDGTLLNANASYLIGSDIRDVACDDRFVYVTDESTLGGSPVGVQVFAINPDGSLTAVGVPNTTGGTRPSHMAVVAPVSTFAPSDYTIVEGIPFGGTTASLLASDDDKVYVLNDETTPNAVVECVGTSYVVTPWKTEFKVELGSTRDDLSYFFELFDFGQSAWDLLGTAASTLADSLVSVEGLYTNGNYLNNAVDAQLKARIRVIPTQDLEASDGWTTGIDQVVFVTRT